MDHAASTGGSSMDLALRAASFGKIGVPRSTGSSTTLLFETEKREVIRVPKATGRVPRLKAEA